MAVRPRPDMVKLKYGITETFFFTFLKPIKGQTARGPLNLSGYKLISFLNLFKNKKTSGVGQPAPAERELKTVRLKKSHP